MSEAREIHREIVTKVLDIQNTFKIAETPVTATAAQLNTLAGASFDRATKTARVALAAVDTAGGIFSWQNPEGTAIVVTRSVVDATTAATGACSISVGSTSVSGATSSANLIDTLDVHTAAGTFDNLGSPGSGGKPLQKVAAGKWVTGSKASGASAGLVGFAYITYFLI